MPLASVPPVRDLVHSQLTELLKPGGPLAQAPSTLTTFFTEAVQDEIVDLYRNSVPSAPAQGHAAIITAGPPGAGKSTSLAGRLGSYRRIDPDEIKDLLLARALQEGLLSRRTDHLLADGDVVAPGELAGWVHGLSTQIADLVRGKSLFEGENFVMEGTLLWPNLAQRYSSELGVAQFEDLLIVDVEVPVELAIQRARGRWWTGRQSGTALGGRFVSDETVERFYENGHSPCSATAYDLHHQSMDLGINSTLEVSFTQFKGGEMGARIDANGVSKLSGSPLGVPCVRCGALLTSSKSVGRGMGDSCAAQS